MKRQRIQKNPGTAKIKDYVRLNHRRCRNRNETLPPKIEKKKNQGIREKYKITFPKIASTPREDRKTKSKAYRQREAALTDAVAVYQRICLSAYHTAQHQHVRGNLHLHLVI